MRHSMVGLGVILAAAIGCDVNVTVDGKKAEDSAPAASVSTEEGDSDGISVKWPGGGFDLKDGKVDVDSPGADVDVDLSTGETGVDVK